MKYSSNGEHGGFKIPMKGNGGFHNVPNKLAAGMLTTRQRNKEIRDTPSIDAIRLAYYGTLDKLAGKFITRGKIHTVGVCPCCGHDIRKLRLHPDKRAKLNNLRAKYGRD